VAAPPHAQETVESFLSQVPGKTQPILSRRGIIAPVVQHPVTEVLVAPGDRVTKDQPLVKLDADEPEADVRAKKAAVAELKASLARLKAEPRVHDLEEAEASLETYRVATRAARRRFEQLGPLWQQGAIPEQSYHEASATSARSEAEERAAAARLARLRKRPFDLEVAELEAKIIQAEEALKAAAGELEHYTLTAPIDGVVSRLEVSPGAVAWPGRTVWGEIVDLREIDVRCDLTPEQADAVAVRQTVEVRRGSREDARWHGQVVYVGVTADPESGRVPVLVRLANPAGQLRSGVPVTVKFNDGTKPGSQE
jgi:multidrug resistance efflux pump